jgi:hypothetical protein
MNKRLSCQGSHEILVRTESQSGKKPTASQKYSFCQTSPVKTPRYLLMISFARTRIMKPVNILRTQILPIRLA